MNKLMTIEHKNQRVLTTQQLAKGYGADTNTITVNFSRNRERYTEGKHYFCLEGEALKAFKGNLTNCNVAQNVNKLYLWTEKGALLHAKSLNTDRAWEVYDMLVETYFRARETFVIPKTLPEALRFAAELAEQIDRQKPLVSFAQTCAASRDSVLIRELAKIASKNGVITGEKRLYQRLRAWGFIFPNSTEPYQEYVDRGYFEVTQSNKEVASGNVRLFKVTRVTPKGQIYILNRLKKESMAG
ncbi:phage antirepressor KilAC domain-containing protein [Pelotomaculum propionicicum]|uniref:Antirepressor protein C-terminal domain-containing protein n=1 Tax=Pelotomaculum propionicicum TaxID=258475 RepID=A0A4Y7RYM7_9FIRM|nr:phage antirepressor KilAC domain-containing protein [Pelotomaculum propionicicum]TEB13417.1 hypothetical protein Pmgp_00311 [Pelotomaculum propionicicum]